MGLPSEHPANHHLAVDLDPRRSALREFRLATLSAMADMGGIPFTDRMSRADEECVALGEEPVVFKRRTYSTDAELREALRRMLDIYDTEVRGDPTSTIAAMQARMGKVDFARNILKEELP